MSRYVEPTVKTLCCAGRCRECIPVLGRGQTAWHSFHRRTYSLLPTLIVPVLFNIECFGKMHAVLVGVVSVLRFLGRGRTARHSLHRCTNSLLPTLIVPVLSNI